MSSADESLGAPVSLSDTPKSESESDPSPEYSVEPCESESNHPPTYSATSKSRSHEMAPPTQAGAMELTEVTPASSTPPTQAAAIQSTELMLASTLSFQSWLANSSSWNTERATFIERERAAVIERERAAFIERERAAAVEREHAAVIERERAAVVERELAQTGRSMLNMTIDYKSLFIMSIVCALIFWAAKYISNSDKS